MMTSQLRHADVIIIRVSHVGRVSPSGEEDEWGPSARLGKRLAGA